jgi:hypothetical protein
VSLRFIVAAEVNRSFDQIQDQPVRKRNERRERAGGADGRSVPICVCVFAAPKVHERKSMVRHPL